MCSSIRTEKEMYPPPRRSQRLNCSSTTPTHSIVSMQHSFCTPPSKKKKRKSGDEGGDIVTTSGRVVAATSKKRICDPSEDLIARIRVLLKQEGDHYMRKDYLDASFQRDLVSSGKSPPSGINQCWREKICEWSYVFVDHFDFNREVVEISISFLDRYLSTRIVHEELFQLAAMTTLHLAIKLNESQTLSMSNMIGLVRGTALSVGDMEAMEKAILIALSWHVHPPTTHCFMKHVIQLILPEAADDPYCLSVARHSIFELARFLTELSVGDYFFVIRRSSSNSLAALLNAMDILKDDIPLIHLAGLDEEFMHNLKEHANIDANSEEVRDCRTRLRELYKDTSYCHKSILHQCSAPKICEPAGSSSPTDVLMV